MQFTKSILAFLGAAALSYESGGVSAFVAPSSLAIQSKSTTTLQVKTRGEGYGPPLENISEAVGNTPMVKISDRICPPGR